jgi:hypothetical protein
LSKCHISIVFIPALFDFASKVGYFSGSCATQTLFLESPYSIFRIFNTKTICVDFTYEQPLALSIVFIEGNMLLWIDAQYQMVLKKIKARQNGATE